ncbi:MAG: 3-deoxy-7-phosphoheptulonate synthase [Clostridiales bacterium]|nr:3-deoxy-7-phosphoheptulonate synthase [Clostridiales bacterium]
MALTVKREIPSHEAIIKETPLPKNLAEIKAQRDRELKEIIGGESDRFLVIIGPCSANSEDAVCDYVSRLAPLQEKLGEKILIVPRIYTNKPRTTGDGYKGMLHQPRPEEEPNMLEGIYSIRKMHIRAISESHLTAADEMLYPDNLIFVEDMLSYIAIGARSVENQQHRLASSGIDAPVGMKNPTSGDLTIMFNAIYAAQSSHTFIYRNHEVETSGNIYAHAIMRGSVSKHGENMPNYHYEDLTFANKMYTDRSLKNPAIIIDTNHSNSLKNYAEQPRIAREILYSRKYNADIKKVVKGLLIESYIEEGSQDVSGQIYGKSITDGCIGWDETERLLYYIAENC